LLYRGRPSSLDTPGLGSVAGRAGPSRYRHAPRSLQGTGTPPCEQANGHRRPTDGVSRTQSSFWYHHGPGRCSLMFKLTNGPELQWGPPARTAGLSRTNPERPAGSGSVIRPTLPVVGSTAEPTIWNRPAHSGLVTARPAATRSASRSIAGREARNARRSGQ